MIAESLQKVRGRRPRVLVVGDVMLDQYVHGACERISPEAPVAVVAVAEDTAAPGGAGNVMGNLVALGAEVSAASVVGADSSGEQVRRLLAEQGVDVSGILVDSARRTSHKTRVLAAHQQMLRLDRESLAPITAQMATALLERMDVAGPFDAVLLSDYDKGVLTPAFTRQMIDWAQRRRLPVLVDPKGRDFSKYRGATLVTPNRREAARATGIELDSGSALRSAACHLRLNLDLDFVIITLSEDGMLVFDGQQSQVIAAAAREVFDVTGAGDTVLATLGFGIACGLPVPEAAHLANAAAAIVVGKLGSATADWDEIARHHRPSPEEDGGRIIQSLDRIEPIVERLRNAGQRIAFTNGCFDLLHRGHVAYLEASKALADVLIVGINSDDSVRRLKGPQRPVMSEADRAYLLASLRHVDYVVVFDQDTPLELIRRVQPDVLTKGLDYAGREVVGSRWAGEVRLIPLVDGRSTTATIDRIREAA